MFPPVFQEKRERDNTKERKKKKRGKRNLVFLSQPYCALVSYERVLKTFIFVLSTNEKPSLDNF